MCIEWERTRKVIIGCSLINTPTNIPTQRHKYFCQLTKNETKKKKKLKLNKILSFLKKKKEKKKLKKKICAKLNYYLTMSPLNHLRSSSEIEMNIILICLFILQLFKHDNKNNKYMNNKTLFVILSFYFPHSHSLYCLSLNLTQNLNLSFRLLRFRFWEKCYLPLCIVGSDSSKPSNPNNRPSYQYLF